ncbi:M20 family metallopeptidase [Verrucomicrobiota bacterium]
MKTKTLDFESAPECLPDITRIRHQIHENPEIALHEHNTAALVRETLNKNGIETLAPFLGTDVVAMIHGSKQGRNVTLRADMDALPLQEKTGLPYQSKTDGLMHACGHDGHTAMLIGAALVLNKLKESFDGSIRFVFQPGEEVEAAGKQLVKKGVLKDPEPSAVFALHSFDDLPVGAIASKPGVFLAAAEFFKITVKGRGAHGAMPHKSIDPILTASRIVEALQTVPSRLTPPLHPVVLSVCRLAGGTNSNIIPDTVEMEGTTRYLDPDTGNRIPILIEQLVKGVCDSVGASYEFIYEKTYIPTINDPAIVECGRKVTEKHIGKHAWFDISEPSMGGEDFAFYLKDYPGAMFRLGMGENSPPLHNPAFDFNDQALKNGILFLVAAALESL